MQQILINLVFCFSEQFPALKLTINIKTFTGFQ